MSYRRALVFTNVLGEVQAAHAIPEVEGVVEELYQGVCEAARRPSPPDPEDDELSLQCTVPYGVDRGEALRRLRARIQFRSTVFCAWGWRRMVLKLDTGPAPSPPPAPPPPPRLDEQVDAGYSHILALSYESRLRGATAVPVRVTVAPGIDPVALREGLRARLVADEGLWERTEWEAVYLLVSEAP